MEVTEGGDGEAMEEEEGGEAKPAEAAKDKPAAAVKPAEEAKKPEADKGKKRKAEDEPFEVKENEPEIPESLVCLDWFNSDLNLRITDDLMTGLPFNRYRYQLPLWSYIEDIGYILHSWAQLTNNVASAKR